jgi:predicted DNA-binding protein (MmcQ/YjbR family)
MTRQEIIDYCLTLPLTYEDYPFDEVIDDNATTVMRHRSNKKSFALIMKHCGQLYLNLKCDPFEADFLRQMYESLIPGYHMNKQHWNTIIIGDPSRTDCDVPDDEIRRIIEASYDLTKPKVRRKNKEEEHE